MTELYLRDYRLLTGVVIVPLLMSFMVLGCGNVGNPFDVGLEPSLHIDQVNPADGATGVSIHTLISLSFPTKLDIATLGSSNIVLQDSAGRVIATNATYDDLQRVVTVRPLEALAGNMRHSLVLQGIRSSAGIPFVSQTLTFSTGSATEAPAVIAVTPLPDQTMVPRNTEIQLVFSEPMNRASVEAAFSIDRGVSGSFTWSEDSTRVTFSPAEELWFDTRYTVTLLNTATNPEGIPLAQGMSWYFTTRATSLFRVVESSPSQGATTAVANTSIRFVFNEPVDRTTVVTNFAISPGIDVMPDHFTFLQNDQVVVYNPPELFSAGDNVRTTWSADLASVHNERLETPYLLSFFIETNPPQIIEIEPPNGAVEVPADVTIRITFSEPLDPSSDNISLTNFALEQNVPLVAALSLENNDRTVVMQPLWHFSSAAGPVTVTISEDVRDLAGTPMGTTVVSSFNVDSIPPGIAFSIPADGATQIHPLTVPTVVISFTEPVSQALTADSFAITPDSAAGGVIAWPSSDRLHYTTTTPLVGATTYTVSITMTDLAGNSAFDSFSFETDSIPPTAALVTPIPGSTDVPLDTSITIQFSEQMRRQTIEDSFSLTDGLSTIRLQDGEVTWDDDTWPSQLTFQPTLPLGSSRDYTVTVTSGAQDIGGLGLSPELTAIFRTITP